MSPRVVVVDPSPFVRMAVRDALERDGITLCAELAGADGAAEAAADVAADVVVVDAGLDPRMELVRRLSQDLPGAAVIVLAPDHSEALALAAVRAGACGIVPMETAPERLPAIVRGVLAGEAAIPRRLMRCLLEELRSPAAAADGDRRPALSAREREVLDLLSAGLPDRAVAASLDISEITVRRHAASAARKFGARHRQETLAGYRSVGAGRPARRRTAA